MPVYRIYLCCITVNTYALIQPRGRLDKDCPCLGQSTEVLYRIRSKTGSRDCDGSVWIRLCHFHNSASCNVDIHPNRRLVGKMADIKGRFRISEFDIYSFFRGWHDGAVVPHTSGALRGFHVCGVHVLSVSLWSFLRFPSQFPPTDQKHAEVIWSYQITHTVGMPV